MTARAVLVLLLVLILTPAAAQDLVAPAVRNVTPPGFTPGPPATGGPLIREQVVPPAPEAERWRRYALPATTDAATFKVRNGLLIHIAGVTPPLVDSSCRFADGRTWACGRAALTRFRLFIRGRPVECLFPYSDGLTDVTAPCRIGTIDLAEWLIRSGWGVANDLATDAYRTAEAEAKCARRGMWLGTAHNASACR